jgi:anti-sigma regulatory factor (Ser/Thr protein kinase)
MGVRTAVHTTRGDETTAVHLPAQEAPSADDVVLGAITLPGVERSVANARRFVRDILGGRHPALDDISLGVSELATNAIKHTPSGNGGKITVRLAAAGSSIRAEVTNDGRTTPAKPGPESDAEAEEGRGILIVEALADAWGVTEHADSTTVWASFRTGQLGLTRLP